MALQELQKRDEMPRAISSASMTSEQNSDMYCESRGPVMTRSSPTLHPVPQMVHSTRIIIIHLYII